MMSISDPESDRGGEGEGERAMRDVAGGSGGWLRRDDLFGRPGLCHSNYRSSLTILMKRTLLILTAR